MNHLTALAEALARHLAKGSAAPEQTIEVDDSLADQASFALDTPFGRLLITIKYIT
jgi:hypothetical protein